MRRKNRKQMSLNFNPPWPGPDALRNATPDTASILARGAGRPKPRVQGRLNWLTRWDKDKRQFIPVDCQLLAARIAKS